MAHHRWAAFALLAQVIANMGHPWAAYALLLLLPSTAAETRVKQSPPTPALGPINDEDMTRVRLVEKWLDNGGPAPAHWDVRTKADVEVGKELARGRSKCVRHGRIGTAKVVVVAACPVTNATSTKFAARTYNELHASGETIKRKRHVVEELYFFEALRGRPGIPRLRGAFRDDDDLAIVVDDCGSRVAGHDRGGKPRASDAWRAFAKHDPLGAARALLELFRSVVDYGGYVIKDFTPYQFTLHSDRLYVVDGPDLALDGPMAAFFREKGTEASLPAVFLQKACRATCEMKTPFSETTCCCAKNCSAPAQRERLIERCCGSKHTWELCHADRTRCALLQNKPHAHDAATAWWALPLILEEAQGAARAAVAAARGRLLHKGRRASFGFVLGELEAAARRRTAAANAAQRRRRTAASISAGASAVSGSPAAAPPTSTERACRTYAISSSNDTAQRAVWAAVPRTACEVCLLFTEDNCSAPRHACPRHHQTHHQTRHDCPLFRNAVYQGWPALRDRASTYAWPSWLPGPNASARCAAFQDMRARRDVTKVWWMGDSVARQIVETSSEYCGYSPFEQDGASFRYMPERTRVWDHASAGRWQRGVMGLASRTTVLVINTGLHYLPENIAELGEHLKVLFDGLLEIIEATGTVALFAEMTAQHFPTETGGFFASGVHAGARPIPHYDCVPASFRNATCHSSGQQHPDAKYDSGWRNAVAWDAFRAAQLNRTGGPTPRLRMLRLHDLTQPRVPCRYSYSGT